MGRKHDISPLPQSVRIVTSIVLLAVVCSVCITLLGLIRQSNEADAQRILELENALQLTQEKTNQQINTLYQLAVTVHNNPALRKVARHEYNIVDELNAMSQLENLMMTNPLLVYSYYYVQNTQRLFCQDGTAYQFPERVAYFLPYEGVTAQQIQELLKNCSGLCVLPSCKSIEGGESHVVVMALPIPLSSIRPYATLLMEVNKSKLLRTVMPVEPNTEIVFVFEHEGIPVFSNSESYEKLESTERVADGRTLYENEGQIYHLFSTASAKTNLSIRMYVPEQNMRAGLLSTVQKSLIIFVCACMLLLLCPFLYLWTYQPMKLLLEKLAGDQPSHFPRGDYAIVLQEIEQLRHNNTVMLGEIGLNTNLMKATLVRSLLEYENTPEDFIHLCERAELKFRYPYFRLVLTTTRKVQTHTKSDEYFFQLARDDMDVYAVKSPDMLCLLVNAREQGSCYELVVELEGMNVMEPAEKSYFGRSGWVQDPALLHKHYRRALDRLHQNLFHGAIGYSEEPESEQPDDATRFYPINEILLLRESSMDFNRERMKEAVKQLQHYLLHEDTKNAVAILVADDVLNILQRHTQAELDSLLECVHRPNITAVEICQVLHESMTLIENAEERSSADTLTEEMLLYISEKLEDPALSSATVSVHFGMSESAFSHAFKKRTGNTFTQYVTDLKIQRAKTLLICSEMSVEAIAERLCYANASSFARMFKNVTSLTPTQYRKLSGENGHSDQK